jgi:hypothetical protein
MRSLVTFLIALAGLAAVPTQAQVLSVETFVEEWDAASQQWVRVEDGANRLATNPTPSRELAKDQALAKYGPFRVTGQDHAELVGVTDKASPGQFAAMLRDYPAIDTLKLVEAPGTDDDRANLRVARMIRSAGITTHVPNGGSVRSGAVELFLAGADRQIDDGAEFAVHSWIDAHGRQPQDFSMDAAPNRMYLDFYREMGMSNAEARAFYNMTNSVSFKDAKWLTAQDMRGWIGQDDVPVEAELVMAAAPEKESSPTIAYLDLNTLLP